MGLCEVTHSAIVDLDGVEPSVIQPVAVLYQDLVLVLNLKQMVNNTSMGSTSFGREPTSRILKLKIR